MYIYIYIYIYILYIYIYYIYILYIYIYYILYIYTINVSNQSNHSHLATIHTFNSSFVRSSMHPTEKTGWQSDVRSCIMPELPTHLV